MYEKAKKLISLSTIRQIEWKSASREATQLGALLLLLFVFRDGFLGVFLFGGITLLGILKEKKEGARGPMLVWGAMNLLFSKGAGLWGLGVLSRTFFFVVSTALYLMARRIPLPFLKKEKEREAREIGNTGLIFLALMSGTYLRDIGRFWAFDLLVCFSVGVLMYEEGKKEGIPRKRNLLATGIGALLALEMAWVMDFLPLHPISFSAILALIYLTFKQVVRRSWVGGLHIKAILQEILVFTTIMLLILSTTSWGL